MFSQLIFIIHEFCPCEFTFRPKFFVTPKSILTALCGHFQKLVHVQSSGNLSCLMHMVPTAKEQGDGPCSPIVALVL